jgi:hypothetical protein
VVFCAVLAGAVGWLWTASKASPQTVTLPNGITYRFAGTTYGTNHVMGSPLEMVMRKLPKPLANLARQALGNPPGRLNTHTTSKPTLCVWFEPLGTNAVAATPSTYAMLADDAGVLSGERETVWAQIVSGVPQWLRLDFPAVPRRSPILYCRYFGYFPDGKYRESGHVPFPNPLIGEYPQWQAETLPTTKVAGDVEVTLENFSSGHSDLRETVSLPGGRTVRRFALARPGEEPRATFELSFKSPRATNEQWTIESAELSDATGNQVRATSRSESEGLHFAIGPTPWTSEHAWKLKLELERKGAFLPEELVTIGAIKVPAVGETNTVLLSNSVAAVTFKRLEFRRREDITGRSWSSSSATCLRLVHSKAPEGYSLDFVKVVSSTGMKLETLGRGWSDDYSEITLKSIPAGVESVDITYAVQQTRTVEFLVKPELATEDKPK